METDVQDAVSAAGTAVLVGRTALLGNSVGAFESTALDDARKSVATAAADVLELEVPDSGSRELRDRVVPPVQEAARLIGDLQAGLADGDRRAAAAAVDGLTRAGEELAGVLR
ncbi:hypothetical protein [Lentzea sp. NPDC060358]|uniref:hypothetical protein n=1 Tax=Lentzea sp. NPDC060358 TaxID=3347103 RepID=UPI003649120A